jgi:hypothetical protein
MQTLFIKFKSTIAMREKQKMSNLDFVLFQPSSPFKIYERNTRQEEDAFMKKETSKTCQLKIAEMRDQILHRKENHQSYKLRGTQKKKNTSIISFSS